MIALFKWLLLFHPFYVSLTEITHNPKTQELEIGIRMFTTDLEATLQKNNPAVKVDLTNGTATEKPKLNGLIFQYINHRFKLSANGRPCPIIYVGFENVEENTWCYFEVKNIATLQTLHISNTILYDWQQEQTNMHVVKSGGKEKTYKLGNPDSEVNFSF